MRTRNRVLLVLAGYAAAFLIACGTVMIHVAMTSGPTAQASSGMYAFGDSLLFLAVLGVASIPSTIVALYFLRPWRPFWVGLCIVAPAVAITGVPAVVVFLSSRSAPVTPDDYVSPLSILRILVAPLFAAAFFLAALMAPGRSTRFILFATTLMEAGVFAVAGLLWLQQIHGH